MFARNLVLQCLCVFGECRATRGVALADAAAFGEFPTKM
jgi:hypothetical protein